ncbi:hypothetical protein HYPSUDRAFT_200532 [Hypholoma sublateritium FD-334 SS-4]|uniref:Uncharacterized protein n=1 Tax=Hypholoma sublateritium (strain FD-334 SS-4) TaxID=945553 RepID=A0A0D2MLG7_HYPSF|nr:hypothetical protein HYPSUDRAFT_200532 [Hypholoma sublateritium FD-334 SS-4]
MRLPMAPEHTAHPTRASPPDKHAAARRSGVCARWLNAVVGRDANTSSDKCSRPRAPLPRSTESERLTHRPPILAALKITPPPGKARSTHAYICNPVCTPARAPFAAPKNSRKPCHRPTRHQGRPSAIMTSPAR